MKIISISIIMLLTISNYAFAETTGEIRVGEYLPNAILNGLTGKSKKIHDFRGKPLIINVWASWCGPCREEMSSIDHLTRYRKGENFNVIGISTDDDANAALLFIKESKITFSQYIDSNVRLENMLGANTIPLTILVDAQGRVLKKIRGSQEWDSPKSLAMISKVFQINLN
jgi:peroxiredoxin